MPAERIGMRDAREVIRLKSSCVSTHEIARRLGLARSTVRETLKRAETAGIAWPLPEDMNDGALEAALYTNRRSKRGHRRIEEPDWASVHRELKRKHVTLMILWNEYIAANPDGYSAVLRALSVLREDAVGYDAPVHFVLLRGEDVFDVGSDIRFQRVGPPGCLRHGAAWRLSAMNAADEAVFGQEFLVGLRAISRVGPNRCLRCWFCRAGPRAGARPRKPPRRWPPNGE